MKTRNILIVLAVVSLLVSIAAFAKNEPGDVPAPTNLSYSTDPGDELADPPVPPTVTFDWDDVAEAEKYSLDICGVVLVDYTVDTVETLDVPVEWCVSFGTSDWNPDAMSDPTITIPLEDLHAAIDAAIDAGIVELGISLDDVDDKELVEMYAKVKGLDPHDKTDKKRQNNLFSDPLDLMPHPAL